MSFSWLFFIFFIFFFPFRKAQNHTEFSGFVYLFCFSGEKKMQFFMEKKTSYASMGLFNLETFR